MYKKFLYSLFLISLLFTSCNFFASLTEESTVSITSLTLEKKSMSVEVGGMDYISVKIKPDNVQKDVRLNWEYDDSIISCDTSSPWGITVTGIKEGKTSLKCSYGGYDAVCMIIVAGYAEGYNAAVEPYIYSNTTILTTAPGVTERVYVSLYGGTVADIEGYQWTVDNPSIAQINPSGQYCLITAKDSGYTRIKVTHSKSAYPYYIGVYVFEDVTNVTYITTSNNVLTMNQEDSSRTIEVNLMNGKQTSLDSSFQWEIVNTEGEIPVKIEPINNQAVVTPIKNGTCTIRVNHPDALYPLDILCRVITVVENVYIQPDNTIVTIAGSETAVITSDLMGLKEGEYNIEDYRYELSNTDAAEIVSYVGNQVMIKGKKNGSSKLIIKHPKAAYNREVLLIINGQIADAVDASCYITTNQNYIKTKIGAEPTELLITMKGGDPEDSYNFTWEINSVPEDGSSDKVIELTTATGSVIHSRAAASTYSNGVAYIKPLKEGTAIITLNNPKVEYPTEVLIRVLGEQAIIDQPLYFTGCEIIYLLNGQKTEVEIGLYGDGYTQADDSAIKWACDNSNVKINANGKKAEITAPAYGSGTKSSWITLSHPKAEYEKSVLLITADTEEELKDYKAIYSDKLYYNLEVGSSTDIILHYIGFDQYDDSGNIKSFYDFSALQWTVDDPAICYIEGYKNNPLLCKIQGLKTGTTYVRARIGEYTCSFTVTIFPEGTVNVTPDIYFTTSQNVVSIDSAGKTAKVSISAIQMPSRNYSEIKWESADESIATVQPNGNNAVITAKKEGETIVTVSHPSSANTLKIYVRIGSEYVIKDADPTVYISSTDVMSLLKDSPQSQLQAVLVNYSGVDTSGFKFTSDNPDVASITAQSTNGTAYIKPVAAGQAEITISHTACEYTKKVLVLVGNSEEELAGIKYLTTATNVVAVGEGNTKSVSVSVKNSDEIVLDGYTWSTSNASVVGVEASGANAVLTGNGIGTCVITVKNKTCQYALTIIAQCVDPIAAAANPYIQLTSSVQLLTVGSNYTSVTADLVGGTDADKSSFIWQSNDTSICMVYGQNEVGKLKALKAGTTYVTVSHPKANYSAQLLVVCDEESKSECVISVPQSIISMKPTDSSQSFSATLVNGSDTDKYNFKWSLDVYDVIDIMNSANQFVITPKQAGTCTLTITHPKAAHDAQIVINVAEYTTFAFPADSYKITRGEVSFLNMQVPVTKQTCHIEYSVDDKSKCSITGTKSIAQITAIEAGTTIVRAKLIATSTNIVQASAEMMIYVKEADVNVNYISSASTIYTVNKDKSRTLSAVISGPDIKSSDQYDFRWTTNDTDIIKISGLSSDGTVTGQSVYITALKAGEALITCSHPKAQSSLQFYVVVPGTGDKKVSLNKTYLTLTKGSSGSTIKATIENSTSSDDYNMENLIWSADLKDGVEICRVMGNGQTVTVYPVSVGETHVTAQLSNGSIAKCTVVVEAGKSFTFETNTKVVQPFHSKTVKYMVSPPDANLTWTTSQGDDYFTYNDLGHDSNGVGYVEIEGMKQGSGTLYCVADSNIKAQLNVKIAWDYSFMVGATTITGTPNETKVIRYYNLNPPDAKIEVSSVNSEWFDYSIIETKEGEGEIEIRPLQEFYNPINIIIRAINPVNDDIIGTKTVQALFNYSELTLKGTIISSDGNYSSYDNYNRILTIGDGETIEMKFDVVEEMANGAVVSVDFQPLNETEYPFSSNFITKGNTYLLQKFSHKEDYLEYQYKIKTAKKPAYYTNYSNDVMGNVVKSGLVEIDNWKDDMIIETRQSTSGIFTTYYNDWIGIGSKSFSSSSDKSTWYWWVYDDDTTCYPGRLIAVDNPDEVGKIYTEEEFKKIYWYYRPNYYWGRGAMAHMTETIWNCTYEKMPLEDNTVIDKTLIGNLLVTINHNNNIEKNIQISVFVEKRGCIKTFK